MHNYEMVLGWMVAQPEEKGPRQTRMGPESDFHQPVARKLGKERCGRGGTHGAGAESVDHYVWCQDSSLLLFNLPYLYSVCRRSLQSQEKVVVVMPHVCG